MKRHCLQLFICGYAEVQVDNAVDTLETVSEVESTEDEDKVTGEVQVENAVDTLETVSEDESTEEEDKVIVQPIEEQIVIPVAPPFVLPAAVKTERKLQDDDGEKPPPSDDSGKDDDGGKKSKKKKCSKNYKKQCKKCKPKK